MARKSKATIEAEARAAAEQAAREAAALRWTDDSDIAPDVAPPDRYDVLSEGYYIIVSARRVVIACSSSVAHGIGRADKTNSRDSIWLYSTRERALRALRCAMEREFAAELAKIDAQLN